MTNQPTNNGWIIDAAKEIYNEVVCEDWENTTDPKNAIKKIILDNLPKPTEVVAPVEAIMEDMFGEYKDSSEGFSVIPNRVRITLKKHLSYKLNKFTEL